MASSPANASTMVRLNIVERAKWRREDGRSEAGQTWRWLHAASQDRSTETPGSAVSVTLEKLSARMRWLR